VRGGGHHYLPEVRWVSEYLLVAGHAGIKTDLAGGGANGTDGVTFKTFAIR